MRTRLTLNDETFRVSLGQGSVTIIFDPEESSAAINALAFIQSNNSLTRESNYFIEMIKDRLRPESQLSEYEKEITGC